MLLLDRRTVAVAAILSVLGWGLPALAGNTIANSIQSTSDYTTQVTTDSTSGSTNGGGNGGNNGGSGSNNNGGSSDGGGAAVLITVSATLATTIGAGVVLGVIIANNAQKSEAMEMYLQQNALAFRSDVGVGGGPVVRDLADLLGVSEENLDRFRRRLRRLYPDLRPQIAELHDNPRRATRRILRTIVARMAQDSALRRDFARAELLELAFLPVESSSPSPW